MAEIGDVENAIYDIKPIKVSVAEMVEKGFFTVGEIFYHKNGEQAVLVNDKGYLDYNGVVDSMHEIAAKMMNGSRRVNAFDYMYVKRDGKLVSIDEVRANYRNTL